MRLGGEAQGHAELVLALVEVDRLNLRDEREQRQRRELLLEAGEELAVRVDLVRVRVRVRVRPGRATGSFRRGGMG